MVQRVCAALPGGGHIYYWLQRYLGALRRPRFMARFERQRAFLDRLVKRGRSAEKAEIVEVGAGRVPVIPVGFWLTGASRVRTYDINRYLKMSLLRDLLHWISRNEDGLLSLWQGAVPSASLKARLDIVRRTRDDPEKFLKESRIEYVAPGDAARTGLPESSVDIHYSAYTLEHIPGDVIADILREAHRILRPDGLTFHFVDLSDHFSHADASISPVNFLRFEEKEWGRLAGNRFAYHNRLRLDDYERILAKSPFRVVDIRRDIDAEAAEVLQAGFQIASPFRGRSVETLACRTLEILAFRE